MRGGARAQSRAREHNVGSRGKLDGRSGVVAAFRRISLSIFLL